MARCCLLAVAGCGVWSVRYLWEFYTLFAFFQALVFIVFDSKHEKKVCFNYFAFYLLKDNQPQGQFWQNVSHSETDGTIEKIFCRAQQSKSL